ncbi:MAG: hypothetical protein AB3N34_02825 [Lettuce witches'-broom phytoplasma]
MKSQQDKNQLKEFKVQGLSHINEYTKIIEELKDKKTQFNNETKKRRNKVTQRRTKTIRP